LHPRPPADCARGPSATAIRSDDDRDATNTVFYAEDSLFVLPTVSLVGGLQYVKAKREVTDRFLSNGDASGSASYEFANPKLGVVWDVTPQAQVFANVSRSGEAPSFSEITVTSGK